MNGFLQLSDKRRLLPILLTMLIMGGGPLIYGQQSACAVVKFVIKQSWTLERQAFEATLQVTNGLPVELKNFQVDVWIKVPGTDGALPEKLKLSVVDDLDVFVREEQGNEVPVFFIRPMPDDGTDKRMHEYAKGGNIIGNQVAPTIYTFRLIPTREAGGELEEGQLYEVGADISYNMGERVDEEAMQVEPDEITVFPLPELLIEYFIPKSVVSDNPFTPEVEPAQPFKLGVRVLNSGAGEAVDLQVESMQPEIVENESGLLLEHTILHSSVNGKAAAPTLTADFGNLKPKFAEVACWEMTSSLYGLFIDIGASFTHSDELGGRVTSLIPDNGIETYRLVGVVQANDDQVPDFLSVGGGTGRNPEGSLLREDFLIDITDAIQAPFLNLHSSGPDVLLTGQVKKSVAVANYSSHIESSNEVGGDRVVVNISQDPIVSGDAKHSFFRIPEPNPSRKNQYRILSVVRRHDGDEVALPLTNVWLATEVNEQGGNIVASDPFKYYIDVFDIGLIPIGAEYTIVYGEKIVNEPPELTPTSDMWVKAGNTVSLSFTATDTDGPALAPMLRMLQNVGGAFTDHGEGTASLVISPSADAAASSTLLMIEASDGAQSVHDSFQVHVVPQGEQVIESWFKYYGLNLSDDLTGDPDGDGLSNLLEYALNLDPLVKSYQGLPTVGTAEDNGSVHLTLSTMVREDPNLTYMAGTSGESTFMVSDHELAESENLNESPSLGNGFKELVWKDPTVLATSRFIRLNVTYNPPEAQ